MWRSFWRLARPYWFGEDRWAGRGLLAVLIVLSLALVWVSVRLNTWQGAFYDALQNKDFAAFKVELLNFTWIAFLFIILSVYQLYLNQMLNMRWRRWLTDVHLQRWMSEATHYRLSLADFGTDNPDQRIAEDLRDFVTDTLSLFFGLLSSVVSFVSFVGILWMLSGPIELGGVTIPGYMVWVALVYSIAGSVLAHWVGKPLIALNFAQQRYEADFRFALVRARENAEGIALYHGEADELRGFRERFGRVVGNWWQIMRRQKRFTWFSSFYGQLAIIFPLLVAAPRYFSGAIQLGGLIQISNAFGKVQESLSWLVDAYTRVADWRAAIARLDGFERALDAARALAAHSEAGLRGNPSDPAAADATSVGGSGVGSTQAGVAAAGARTAAARAADAIDFGDVSLGVPAQPLVRAPEHEAVTAMDGASAAAVETPPQLSTDDRSPIPLRVLLTADGQRIEAGQHTVITGPSGSGKSTLFRLLSGLWPFAQGHMHRPDEADSLFLPQKPYLPLGSLRAAVCYPQGPGTHDDAAITSALHAVTLDALASRLDEVANWSQILSGGEQQRLAIARALLIQPHWLFLDEATSALDESTEALVYQALLDRLPGTTLVSIAHRPTVERFHRQVLRVQPQVDGPATLGISPVTAAAGAA